MNSNQTPGTDVNLFIQHRDLLRGLSTPEYAGVWNYAGHVMNGFIQKGFSIEDSTSRTVQALGLFLEQLEPIYQGVNSKRAAS